MFRSSGSEDHFVLFDFNVFASRHWERERKVCSLNFLDFTAQRQQKFENVICMQVKIKISRKFRLSENGSAKLIQSLSTITAVRVRRCYKKNTRRGILRLNFSSYVCTTPRVCIRNQSIKARNCDCYYL